MKFAPDEAKWFWPTYEQYVNELVNMNNAKYALIKEYLQNENMADEQADSLSKRCGCIRRPTSANSTLNCRRVPRNAAIILQSGQVGRRRVVPRISSRAAI